MSVRSSFLFEALIFSVILLMWYAELMGTFEYIGAWVFGTTAA